MKRLLAILLFVQPILSENCYRCHGPNKNTLEPKKNPLRLDREEFAFLERPDGKPSIIKGDPEASELIERIIATNPDHLMPSGESHTPPRGFSMWMAGGGFIGGEVYGETEDFSYDISATPLHISELHATSLHQLGLDHHKLTFQYQGLDQKLTGVEPPKILTDLLV